MVKNKKKGNWGACLERGQSKRTSDYAVALEADEVHRHGDGAVAVPVQSLDVVQQVREEFVAPFKHAEGHDVVAPHLLHDLAGQPLGPEVTREEPEPESESALLEEDIDQHRQPNEALLLLLTQELCWSRRASRRPSFSSLPFIPLSNGGAG